MTEDTIQIDGSQGEGGGQIVRSSLALSMVTGRPVTIERVRAGRAAPGLMRQHLAAVQAAQQICRASVSGADLGSSTLVFQPGPVVPGDYMFTVGTAGSATLVLQTLLPPLLIAGGSSRLVLEGGTHNPWAPPFDFLQRSFLPLVNRMGPRITARLERHGFYPAGGGRFVVEIQPGNQPSSASRSFAQKRSQTPSESDQRHQGPPAIAGQTPGSGKAASNVRDHSDLGLTSFDLLERGGIRSRRGRVLLSNLPDHIAERELAELAPLARWDVLVRETPDCRGPGNVVLLELECEHVTEVFIGFGKRGVKAEVVARQAFEAMRAYLEANVPVGPFLADQLLLPLGLCAWQSGVPGPRRRGSFRTMRLTAHSQTHIAVLQEFLSIPIDVDEDPASGATTVTVG